MRKILCPHAIQDGPASGGQPSPETAAYQVMPIKGDHWKMYSVSCAESGDITRIGVPTRKRLVLPPPLIPQSPAQVFGRTVYKVGLEKQVEGVATLLPVQVVGKEI